VLGTLVLLAFVAALGAVGVIAFVLFGPVPVNRKVTIVSRIQPVAMPRAALPIQLQAPIEVVFAAASPPPPPAPRRAAAVDSPIVPLALRRPRGDTPPPRPPQRMARGTQGRPRQDFDSVEVTAPQAPSFDVDEMTHVEDTNLH
jgi:hypothetical protein